jgi:hypothetical protein
MLFETIVNFSPTFNSSQLKILQQTGGFYPVSRQVHHQNIEFI